MTDAPAPPAAPPGSPPVATDLADERLIQTEGFGGYVKASLSRLRHGELGSLPVVIGLIIICIGFYSAEPRFLSSRSLVSISQFAAPIGIIALGIVLVLLLGEIDLSVGSVSGLAAASMAVLLVERDQSIIVGDPRRGPGRRRDRHALRGPLHQARSAVASSSRWRGSSDSRGCCCSCSAATARSTCPRARSWSSSTRFKFVGDAMSYVLVALIVALYLATKLWGIRTRAAAGLSTPSAQLVVGKAVALGAGLGFLTYYINIDRGWSYLWLFFVLMVVVMDVMLRRTRWGRHVYAVGGNEEAARRAGDEGDPDLPVGLRALLHVRGDRWSAGRGPADLGLPGQRYDGHQPHRDRGGRHRRHQPLRWPRLGVLGDARHHRARRRSRPASTWSASTPRSGSW